MNGENIKKDVNTLEDQKTANHKVEKVDLYLEQIKYITAENNSIQEKFLSGVDLPLAALGILIYNLELEKCEVEKLYLLLPFFCLFILYNLIKYTIRILINNGYLEYLEGEINDVLDEKVFIMNHGIRDTSIFKKFGFAVLTTCAQVPIYIAISAFLIYRFCQIYNKYDDIRTFANLLIVLLVIEVGLLILMGMDAINVRKGIVEKARNIKSGKDN